jgi:Zn2+/Cd2+-exporting ATPase
MKAISLSILNSKRTAVFAAALSLWALGILLGHFGSFQDLFATVQRILSASPINFISKIFLSKFLSFAFFFTSWLLAGLPVLKNAAKNLLSNKNKALDENFLMSVATIGAFAIGEWAEAAAVMIFYMVGEIIQDAAIDKSRSSIDALLAVRPDKARIGDGDTWKEIPAGEVMPGSLIMIRPGERIPLDGIVTDGKSSVDASILTGESRPVTVVTGSEVFSGTLAIDGVLKVKTTKSAGESSASKIIQLVESAREAKAKPERFITAFARWYTPIVVGAAVLLAILPPLLISGERFTEWFYRALILLVISCPCALVVSVPLGYFAGIGGMSRRGIMVKGATYMDSLNKVRNVAFDKTGTLTKGKFTIAAFEPAPGVSKETLLETAALAESESNHPIARAILEYAGTGRKAEPDVVRSEIAGKGVECVSSSETILAGSRRLLEPRLNYADIPASGKGAGKWGLTSVYVAKNDKYLGRILIGDSLKEGSVETISRLRKMGIQNTMLTGDTRSSAMEAASQLGIDSVKAELLPEDKLREVENLTHSGTTVFVGDGINDAPVLARSNVGIAMGSGADVAVEAADVIIMTDDPRRVPEAIERARKTRRIVMGNIAFALGAKGFFLVLAGLGMANMWVALVADVGVALAAVLNSTRALR